MFSFVQHWKLRVCYNRGGKYYARAHDPFFTATDGRFALDEVELDTLICWGSVSGRGSSLKNGIDQLMITDICQFWGTTMIHLVLQKKKKEMQERQYSANTCD